MEGNCIENNQGNFNPETDFVLAVASDGSLVNASKTLLAALGLGTQEIPVLNIAEILREDLIPHCFTLLDRIKQGENFEKIESVLVSSDGREISVEGSMEGVFENNKFVLARGYFRDVTGRKKLVEPYSVLVRNFPMPIYIIQDGVYKLVNPSFQSATEYSENELLSSDATRLIHPDDRAAVQKNHLRMLRLNKPSTSEFRLIRKSGEARWVLETIVSIPYGGGRAGLGTLVDLTERKLVADALDESKNRYQTLFNSSSDAVYILDVQNNFLEVNDAACKLLGYSRHEFLKLSLSDIKSSDYIRFLQDNQPNMIKTGNFVFESESITREGQRIPTESRGSLIEYEGKKAILTVVRDISERKQMEVIRKRTQDRLESLIKISQFKPGFTRDLLYFALEEMIRLTDSKMGYLYFYNENLKELSISCWSKEVMKSIFMKSIPGVYPLDKTGILGEPVRQRKPVIINAVQNPSITGNGYPEGRYKLNNFISIPIFRDNKIVGLVSLANKASDFDKADVQQLTLFMDSVWNILDRWRAEEALRESERRYRQLIELSQDGILRIDDKGYVVTVNPAACRIFGYSEEELVGLLFSQTYLQEEWALASERLSQVKITQSARFERIAKRKDGSLFPVEVSISPLTQGFFQEVVRDITARKKMENELQESERKYKLLVENQTDLLVEVGSRGELLFVNPAYCKLVGLSKEQLLGTPLVTLFHEEDAQYTALQAGPASNTSQTTYSENRLLTQKGWRWIAWTGNAVLDNHNQVVAFTCLGRDITESKLAKEELEKANQQLIELDKLKDNFLSTVSHELRTPLTSIKSFAEILLNYDEDRATQKEFLGIINDESDRLTRLINDFLDLSKIQAGRMQWQTVELSLTDAINSVAATSRPVIEKARLAFSMQIEPDLPPVLCDKDRLIQVITNLLGNAIKFTPENGKISLQARLEKSPAGEKPDLITVSIKDSGIGIAPENHQRIFEKFGQVGDVLKDRPKGTGLGLPICKKIIENYGGKIRVESALGQGTTFIFSLPAVQKPGTPVVQPADIPSGSTQLSGKTVLVVDDEANIRRFIRHELSARGHNVLEARGGKEAVDLARKYHPDLITLDIAMPDLNGFDVTAVLKNDPATNNIPILIISVVEDRKKAYTLGANDYITKPISIDVLLLRVNRLLEGKHKKILITDDDQGITRSLEFELKKQGFNTCSAANGKEALEAVDLHHPDLILLDIMMPEMDGYEVIKTLKNRPETKDIPIIIMTGIEIDGGRVKALSIGADEYVPKTEGFKRLFEVIEKISSREVTLEAANQTAEKKVVLSR
jgi:PAS domain S-box-containing protein